MTRLDAQAATRRDREGDLRAISKAVSDEEARLRLGGGSAAIERQYAKGRKAARSALQPCSIRKRPRWRLGCGQLTRCTKNGAERPRPESSR